MMPKRISVVVRGQVEENRTEWLDVVSEIFERRPWEIVQLGFEKTPRQSAPQNENQLTQLPLQELTNYQLNLHDQILPSHLLDHHPVSKTLVTVPSKMSTQNTGSTSNAGSSGLSCLSSGGHLTGAVSAANAWSNHGYKPRQFIQSLAPTMAN